MAQFLLPWPLWHCDEHLRLALTHEQPVHFPLVQVQNKEDSCMRPFAEAEECALIAARSEMLRFPRSLAGNLRITLASLMADSRPMATAVDLQRDTFPAVWLVLSRPDFVQTQTLKCRPPVAGGELDDDTDDVGWRQLARVDPVH